MEHKEWKTREARRPHLYYIRGNVLLPSAGRRIRIQQRRNTPPANLLSIHGCWSTILLLGFSSREEGVGRQR
jgi:hypothetical protein